jgi:hypothetical protein
MKTQKIGAGSSFNITIPLPNPITSYENILMAIYTDKNKTVKFSYVEKVGYNKLNVGNTQSELIATLTSAQSDKFDGCLYMELQAIAIGNNVGKSIPTTILNSLGQQIEIIQNVL